METRRTMGANVLLLDFSTAACCYDPVAGARGRGNGTVETSDAVSTVLMIMWSWAMQKASFLDTVRACLAIQGWKDFKRQIPWPCLHIWQRADVMRDIKCRSLSPFFKRLQGFQRIIHRLQVVPRTKKARDVTHLLSLYSTLKTFLGGSPFCFPHLTCSGILHRVEQRLK